MVHPVQGGGGRVCPVQVGGGRGFDLKVLSGRWVERNRNGTLTK